MLATGRPRNEQHRAGKTKGLLDITSDSVAAWADGSVNKHGFPVNSHDRGAAVGGRAAHCRGRGARPALDPRRRARPQGKPIKRGGAQPGPATTWSGSLKHRASIVCAARVMERLRLMADPRLYIEKNRLTQAEAAKRLGIAQSRTSDLPGSTGSALYDKVIDMDTVTISPKFQVVIPRRLRDQLGLKAGGKMRVIRYGDRIELLPARKASDLRGFLKGMDTTLPRDRDRV